jgi:hypothetical protein
MFGFSKKTSDKEQEKQAEIDKAKLSLRKFVHELAELTPEQFERKIKQLKDWCNSDKLVPFDFKQKALKRANDMERTANMLYCDLRLHEAGDAAADEDHKEKGAKLNDARRYFGRACSLGADADWRKAFKRAEEIILMTGGKQTGPTRAKPADIAPPTPNRAKA